MKNYKQKEEGVRGGRKETLQKEKENTGGANK